MGVENGHIQVVKYLLAKKISLQTQSQGMSPLHLAANKGHVDMMRYLVDKGLNPNARDPGGSTPAMTAATGGHVSALEYLIGKGADLHAKDDKGRSAMHGAAMYARHYIIGFLFEEKGLSLDELWLFANQADVQDLREYL